MLIPKNSYPSYSVSGWVLIRPLLQKKSRIKFYVQKKRRKGNMMIHQSGNASLS